MQYLNILFLSPMMMPPTKVEAVCLSAIIR